MATVIGPGRPVETSSVRGRVLRIHDGWDPAAGDPARPPDRPAADGPVLYRFNGHPVGVWAWPRWPRGVPEAIRHPSGIWVALRAL